MGKDKINNTPSNILDSVIRRFKDREKEGLVKYGTTMDRNDLSLTEWLQHLQEEMMDAALYIEKLKQEVEYQEFDLKSYNNMPHLEFPHPRYEESEVGDEEMRLLEIAIERSEEAAENLRERRMDIIGRNGNDGLHYSVPAISDDYFSRSVYPGDIKVTYTKIDKDENKKTK